jgi:hypothetical protein
VVLDKSNVLLPVTWRKFQRYVDRGSFRFRIGNGMSETDSLLYSYRPVEKSWRHSRKLPEIREKPETRVLEIARNTRETRN